MKFSIVIPSKTISNLIPCVHAIREAGEKARIITVWDGDPKSECRPLACRDYQPVESMWGVKPFVFARNVNLGIQAADSDDVVILNDDALLVTSGGFTSLAEASTAHPEYGVIAATTLHTGNPNQWPQLSGQPRTIPNFAPGKTEIPAPQAPGLRDEPYMVCFIAVYVPRRTIEVVGLLDERFVGYGYEDTDYCVRVRRAGLKLGIHDGCFVDHGSLVSTFRGSPTTSGDLGPNLALFVVKWGSVNV
jgi:hypothetical protein